MGKMGFESLTLRITTKKWQWDLGKIWAGNGNLPLRLVQSPVPSESNWDIFPCLAVVCVLCTFCTRCCLLEMPVGPAPNISQSQRVLYLNKLSPFTNFILLSISESVMFENFLRYVFSGFTPS